MYPGLPLTNYVTWEKLLTLNKAYFLQVQDRHHSISTTRLFLWRSKKTLCDHYNWYAVFNVFSAGSVLNAILSILHFKHNIQFIVAIQQRSFISSASYKLSGTNHLLDIGTVCLDFSEKLMLHCFFETKIQFTISMGGEKPIRKI